MPSTFFGLETGRRALAASQLALDVVGQNTSNVGTPGYSRQVAVFEETDPYGQPGTSVNKPVQLGTGVTISSVNRVRDQYLDQRLNGATSDQSAFNSLSAILSRVETAYGEPSANGVGSQITKLFSAFSDLSATPESGGVRATILNDAQSLATAFHSVSTGLSQIGPDITSQIASGISSVNDIATQVAALNKQIGASIANGDHPNDLLDKRTALIAQLSGYVDVQVINSTNAQTYQPTGQVQIDVGGFTLVQGDSAAPLPTTASIQNGTLGLAGANGETIPLTGGGIYGLIKASSLLQGYQSDLNSLASNLISSVNAIHAGGYGLDGNTGRAFFTGKDASDINVSPVIVSNLDAIAAAGPPTPPAAAAPGNGDTARALAALSSQPVIGLFSLNEYYNARVAAVGADSKQFQSDAESQTKVVSQLTNQQSSVSGVNLDEELTKMLQYQRSFQAAARIINVQDDILNRIINGLGSGSTGGL